MTATDRQVVRLRHARAGTQRIDTGRERFECIETDDGLQVFRLWRRGIDGRWRPGKWVAKLLFPRPSERSCEGVRR